MANIDVELIESRGTSGVNLWKWEDGHFSANIYVHQIKAGVFEQLAKILGAEVHTGSMADGSNQSATWIDLKVGEVEVSVFRE